MVSRSDPVSLRTERRRVQLQQLRVSTARAQAHLLKLERQVCFGQVLEAEGAERLCADTSGE